MPPARLNTLHAAGALTRRVRRRWSVLSVEVHKKLAALVAAVNRLTLAATDRAPFAGCELLVAAVRDSEARLKTCDRCHGARLAPYELRRDILGGPHRPCGTDAKRRSSHVPTQVPERSSTAHSSARRMPVIRALSARDLPLPVETEMALGIPSGARRRLGRDGPLVVLSHVRTRRFVRVDGRVAEVGHARKRAPVRPIRARS